MHKNALAARALPRTPLGKLNYSITQTSRFGGKSRRKNRTAKRGKGEKKKGEQEDEEAKK